MRWERWEFTRDENRPPWAMDNRHIEMIEAVMLYGGIRSAVEIGCLKGRSTTAFAEAAEKNEAIESLCFCDHTPRSFVERVIESVPSRVKVRKHWDKSATLYMEADFWVIDGGHSEEDASSDITRAIAGGAKIICVHDHKHRAFPGPGRAVNTHKGHFPYVFEDYAERLNEETERGIWFGSVEPFTPKLLSELQRLAE